MSSTLNYHVIKLPRLTHQEFANLCGVLHTNLKFLEEHYKVSINVKHHEFIIHGHPEPHSVEIQQVLSMLYPLAKQPIDIETIKMIIHEDYQKAMIHTIKLSRKMISARNAKQAAFMDAVDQYDITFAAGPAGTGKTYLAVAKGIQAFEKGEVQRLIFVRPAVEAGEKLGFLPGDLVEKVLPYLRPIYDALYEMIGFKETQKLIQSDIIEVLPLAFMRGRTLNESFIILDEAQNTTTMQMKMFLTRIGFSSKAVVTGDTTQIDLPKGVDSGLNHALRLLKNIPDISIHLFTSKEVVRHPLVSKIIDCYDSEQEKKPK